MTIDRSASLKALFAAGTSGLFAVAVAVPVTLDNGTIAVRSAHAAWGGADDGTPDQGLGDN